MTAPGAEREASIFEELRGSLPPLLSAYLAHQRWFGGKARRIHSTEIVDFIPLQTGEADAFVLVVRVEYQIGSEERYFLPMLSAQLKLPSTRPSWRYHSRSPLSLME